MGTPNPPSKFWQNPPVVDDPVVQDAGYRMNKTDRAYIDSQILALQTKVAAPPPPGPIPYWTPGGPLVWSVVDIVDSVVATGVQAQPIHDTGGPGGFNFGSIFFVVYAGRKCSGVRFRWGSGSPLVSVQCCLWDSINAISDGARTTFAATVTTAAQAQGVYIATFPTPVPLSPGYWYSVSARDTTGRYDCRLPASDPLSIYANHFPSGQGSRSIAPGVLLTAGCPGNSSAQQWSAVGGGGGSPVNYCVCQSGATVVPIEPIII